MALTALDIYKVLPKTNCGECGVPTCLAFAMQLATKKAAIEACPYATDESKATLAGAAAPPIRKVMIGPDAQCVVMGNETVLFRHEETFYHPTAIAVRVRTGRGADAIDADIARVKAMVFDRVGQFVRVEAVALEDGDGDAAAFAAAATAVSAAGLSLVLVSDSTDALDAAAAAVAGQRPLLYAATTDNWEAMTAIAKARACPLAVRGADLNDLADLTRKITAAGVNDLVIDSGARTLGATLANLTQIRRLALRRQFRPLGFPAMAFVTAADPIDVVTEGTAYICKYAGLVVTDMLEPWQALALVTGRQNIFTDPQKPIQVEAGVIGVGNPDASSPILVTTNFSLTYFTVEADVESAKTAAWMLVVDTEGQSVMTAWAADKFNAEMIAKAIADSKVMDRVNHRKVIIPGGVAAISGKLEELSGLDIMVGPRESAGMSNFMRTRWRAAAS
jgi:acetyl-CoA decarbonylase/synthase complex subunit gamma